MIRNKIAMNRTPQKFMPRQDRNENRERKYPEMR